MQYTDKNTEAGICSNYGILTKFDYSLYIFDLMETWTSHEPYSSSSQVVSYFCPNRK